MRKITIGVFAAIVLLLPGSSTSAQEQTWITIDAGGRERGAFVPRDVPYTQDGPSVGVYLFDRQDVRMPDGRALTGFEFIGWAEGAATRVQVFALVPKDGLPNTNMPRGDNRNLARRDFATYLVRSGEPQPVAEMSALGIPPMVLQSVLRDLAPR